MTPPKPRVKCSLLTAFAWATTLTWYGLSGKPIERESGSVGKWESGRVGESGTAGGENKGSRVTGAVSGHGRRKQGLREGAVGGWVVEGRKEKEKASTGVFGVSVCVCVCVELSTHLRFVGRESCTQIQGIRV